MKQLSGNTKKGLIGTILVHSIVLLILLFCGFSAPEVEYPEPDGIMVDFGELVIGDGSGAPEQATSPITPSQAEVSEPSVVTQTEVPSIPIKDKKTTVKDETPQLTPEEQERIRQEEEFKKKMDALAGNLNSSGGSGTSGNGGNSQTGALEGNQGHPNGSGNSGNKKGTPGNPYGNGDAVNLAKPGNTTNCNNPIVLTVEVDKSGRVVRVLKTETALSDQACVEAAKSAAMKTTFSADSRDVRYAKITYDYTVSRN